MQLIDWIPGVKQLKAQVNALQNTNITQLYTKIYPSWHSYKVIQAFKVVDQIFAVVHKLANTAAKIPVYGYDKEGEYLADNSSLSVFLRTLTFTKRVELFTWLYLKDEAFCYKEKTIGLSGKVDTMTFLNPDFVTLVVDDQAFPAKIVYYLYREPYTGNERRIELDEMIFIHGFNPSSDQYERWRGISKVDVLKFRITRMDSNMKNSVAQMQNGGVPGVLYAKNIPNTTQSKGVLDLMRNNYTKFSNNPSNTGAPFIQAGDFGYIAMGLSLVDMDSVELEKMDLKAVANVFAVPLPWLNSEEANTESNVEQMMVQVYTAGIQPYTQMCEDAFNLELVSDFGMGTDTVMWDYSGIPELAKSLLDRVKAMNEAITVIPNDQREVLMLNRIDDPAMDEPWVKSGWEPLSSFTAVEPVTDGPL